MRVLDVLDIDTRIKLLKKVEVKNINKRRMIEVWNNIQKTSPVIKLT